GGGDATACAVLYLLSLHDALPILISVIVALFCGLWFYGSAGSFLLPYVSSKDVANFCGFILIFCGILIAGALIGILLSRLLKVEIGRAHVLTTVTRSSRMPSSS